MLEVVEKLSTFDVLAARPTTTDYCYVAARLEHHHQTIKGNSGATKEASFSGFVQNLLVSSVAEVQITQYLYEW